MRTWLCLILALNLFGCAREKSGKEAEGNAVEVKVFTVVKTEKPAFDEVVGTIRPFKTAIAESKLSAKIEKITVAPGTAVRAGDLLAALDAKEIKSRREQAQAVFTQASNDLRRISALYTQKAVSRAEFDAVQARERAARAGLDEAETMLSYNEVRAPFSGVVSRKFAEVGDLATPGKPLFEVVTSGLLRLEAEVPEANIRNIKMGDSLSVVPEATHGAINGTVSEISPTADTASRTFLIKVDLPSDKRLIPGQFARVLVPRGLSSEIEVPALALRTRGQLDYVFVVRDGKTAVLRLVKPGKRFGDAVQVLAGLEAGEVVVANPSVELLDQQRVRPSRGEA